MCVVPRVVLWKWCLVWMFGHVGHFAVRHLFVHQGFVVGLFVDFGISCMCLVLASLFLSNGFLR